VSLSREATLDLMAFADGELTGEARERTEELLAQSEEARRVVAAMRSGVPAIRFWLVDAFGQQSRRADGIADAVMGAIARAGAPTTVGAPLEQVPPVAHARRARVFTRVVAAAGGLAVAALVAMVLGSGAHRGERAPSAGVTTASSGKIGASPTAVGRIETADLGRGVEVEEIDSAKHVSIFEISGATASAQSVVVWIDDDQEER
jgi:anti-sigma factor RsiW